MIGTIVLMLGEAEREGPLLADILMLAGVLMLLMLLLVNVRSKLRRRQEQEPLHPHEKVERIRQAHGMKNDLRDMMVELEDLTRRFSAQLDAKAVRLEKLIEEADERINRLEGGRGAAGGNGQDGAAADSDTREGEGEGGEQPTTPAEPLDPLTREVYAMADDGNEPVTIARQLDEQVGKVELILALRQR